MHPQILKLAEQAGMYVDLNGKPWPKWMGAEECEAAYARFAELLVKECADYVQFYYKDHMCEVIAHDMKTHFGVER